MKGYCALNKIKKYLNGNVWRLYVQELNADKSSILEFEFIEYIRKHINV